MTNSTLYLINISLKTQKEFKMKSNDKNIE